jgi:pilus assembly protein CpaB
MPPLLRRAQSAAPDLETVTAEPAEVVEETAPAAAPQPPRSEHKGLEHLRAEIQRRMAAQIDLGTPEGETEERRTAPPRPTRPRFDAMRADVQRRATAKPERRSFGSALGGRFRVRPSRLALLGVALVAGGLAAYLAMQNGSASEAAQVPAATQIVEAVPKTQILVAKEPIGIGERLSAASLTWADWPQDSVRPEFITVAAAPTAITDMAGAMARSDFVPGEPIRKEKLAPANQGYLSSVLASGMRAVSVTISAESASGGFIAPNDQVDVVVTRNADGRSVSDTVVQGARVLAINDRLGPNSGAPADPNANASNARVFENQAIATLELDPTEAETIINAATLGKLSLVLRAAGPPPSSAETREAAVNEAIRLTSPFWTTGASNTPPVVR